MGDDSPPPHVPPENNGMPPEKSSNPPFLPIPQVINNDRTGSSREDKTMKIKVLVLKVWFKKMKQLNITGHYKVTFQNLLLMSKTIVIRRFTSTMEPTLGRLIPEI